MNRSIRGAALTEEEMLLFREEVMDGVVKMLASDPERFRVSTKGVSLPLLPLPDRRRKQPDALRLVKKKVFPSRLPWDTLPPPPNKPERVRVIYRTLPAGELARTAREIMRERRVTMEEMAQTLHVSPGTLRRWLKDPELMTVRDYGALANWVNRPAGRDRR